MRRRLTLAGRRRVQHDGEHQMRLEAQARLATKHLPGPSIDAATRTQFHKTTCSCALCGHVLIKQNYIFACRRGFVPELLARRLVPIHLVLRGPSHVIIRFICDVRVQFTWIETGRHSAMAGRPACSAATAKSHHFHVLVTGVPGVFIINF